MGGDSEEETTNGNAEIYDDSTVFLDLSEPTLLLTQSLDSSRFPFDTINGAISGKQGYINISGDKKFQIIRDLHPYRNCQMDKTYLVSTTRENNSFFFLGEVTLIFYFLEV